MIAERELGQHLRSGNGIAADVQTALEWFRKAAEEGDVVAQTELGNAAAKIINHGGMLRKPLLDGAAGDGPAARRLPRGIFVIRMVGVAVALAALPTLGRWMVLSEPENARAQGNRFSFLRRFV